MVAIDASAVVAALVDSGPAGGWALAHLRRGGLVAPHLLAVETANVLRRSARTGSLSPEVAALAHRELQALPIEYVPYAPFAERVWQLREVLTAYDAWYVAVAETFGLDLVSLDQRLARAPGPRCRIVTPEHS
jgi:predicted nucleic acid-binding protein